MPHCLTKPKVHTPRDTVILDDETQPTNSKNVNKKTTSLPKKPAKKKVETNVQHTAINTQSKRTRDDSIPQELSKRTRNQSKE